MADARKYTDKLLEKIDRGYVSWERVARECLSEMSEADVEDMCDITGWVDDGDFEGKKTVKAA